MQQAEAAMESVALGAVVSRQVASVRLLVGLLQGLVLYLLYRSVAACVWPATDSHWFAPAVLLAVLLPVLLICSLGHMAYRALGLWIGAAFFLLPGLALHDVWRSVGDGSAGVHYPSPLLDVFCGVGFFIGHTLVLAGAAAGRRVAPYPAYFEKAWTLAIQLLFSALFVGALWLVLELGAALFMLVKLAWLHELLKQAWFAIPVTCFAFSCAMHITDVRPAIVRGVRTLLLVLMSWILPVATLIVAAFLVSLLVVGLSPLWSTRSATTILLGSAATLVVLLNAAFQDGTAAAGVGRLMRLCARLAAVLLLPLTALAVLALGLRVDAYGWSTDRIIVASCLLVAACYALGYTWAALRPDGWLPTLAPVNVATSFLIVALLLALFSPLADPARLAVANQLARLASGQVGAAKFDFDALRFDGARYGRAALAALAAGASGPDAALVRNRVALTLARKGKWDRSTPPLDLATNLTVWPSGARLAPGFLTYAWQQQNYRYMLPACLTQAGKACDAYLIDFHGNGNKDVLLVASTPGDRAVILSSDAAGKWRLVGSINPGLAGCPSLQQQLRAGRYALVAPALPDLQVAGLHLPVDRNATGAAPPVCPPNAP